MLLYCLFQKYLLHNLSVVAFYTEYRIWSNLFLYKMDALSRSIYASLSKNKYYHVSIVIYFSTKIFSFSFFCIEKMHYSISVQQLIFIIFIIFFFHDTLFL